jgi:hypothetical protein
MRPLMIAAALALAAAAPVQAQPADGHRPEAQKAACHGANGKPVPCPPKPAKASPKARAAIPMISRCRDVISHQAAKCGGPNAEPVPAN